jgi:ABC-2 type transport system ATP-binding protein
VQPCLERVAGVQQVTTLESAAAGDRLTLKVVTAAGTELGREIIAGLVQAGIGVYEMRRVQTSLEDVFLQLTTAESGVPGEPADVPPAASGAESSPASTTESAAGESP